MLPYCKVQKVLEETALVLSFLLCLKPFLSFFLSWIFYTLYGTVVIWSRFAVISVNFYFSGLILQTVMDFSMFWSVKLALETSNGIGTGSVLSKFDFSPAVSPFTDSTWLQFGWSESHSPVQISQFGQVHLTWDESRIHRRVRLNGVQRNAVFPALIAKFPPPREPIYSSCKRTWRRWPFSQPYRYSIVNKGM